MTLTRKAAAITSVTAAVLVTTWMFLQSPAPLPKSIITIIINQTSYFRPPMIEHSLPQQAPTFLFSRRLLDAGASGGIVGGIMWGFLCILFKLFEILQKPPTIEKLAALIEKLGQESIDKMKKKRIILVKWNDELTFARKHIDKNDMWWRLYKCCPSKCAELVTCCCVCCTKSKYKKLKPITCVGCVIMIDPHFDKNVFHLQQKIGSILSKQIYNKMPMTNTTMSMTIDHPLVLLARGNDPLSYPYHSEEILKGSDDLADLNMLSSGLYFLLFFILFTQ